MSPAATASSTTYWMAGLSTTGSISFGVDLVAGRNRVPSPAAGTTALVTVRRVGSGPVMSPHPNGHGPAAPFVASRASAGWRNPQQARTPAVEGAGLPYVVDSGGGREPAAADGCRRDPAPARPARSVRWRHRSPPAASGWDAARVRAGPPESGKATLRADVLAARQTMGPMQRANDSRAITRFVLTLPEMSTARRVAAYVSIGTEPATAELLRALRSRNLLVLVPVLRPDRDLDWVAYGSQDQVVLGVDAVSGADLIVVPALAVDGSGHRLGRGGGSYDRALARLPADRLVAALLFGPELVPELPAEPHDRPVTAAVTPSGVHRFGRETAAGTAYRPPGGSG